ncbi:MAG: hypothetical protein VX085_04740 [Pseudomonadota bacterium]|nr:hypothetical protein [Pseudomonadota bacterium]
MDWFTFHVMTVLLSGAAFGGMVLFRVSFAPTVFRTLGSCGIARLMQAVFPSYYLTVGILTFGAAGFLILGAYAIEISLLAGSGVLFVLLRMIMLPMLDEARSDNRPKFARLHRLCVGIQFVQLAAVGVATIRLAQ